MRAVTHARLSGLWCKRNCCGSGNHHQNEEKACPALLMATDMDAKLSDLLSDSLAAIRVWEPDVPTRSSQSGLLLRRTLRLLSEIGFRGRQRRQPIAVERASMKWFDRTTS